MGIELTPTSESDSISGSGSVSPTEVTAEKPLDFCDMLSDVMDTEEEEALVEIDELIKYRSAVWLNDSGFGSSQGYLGRGVSPDSPCRGRKKSTK